MWKRTVVGLGTTLIVAGCAGVSEERVSALEAQLKALQNQPAASQPEDTSTALAPRVESLEKSVAERFSKMEDIMDVLQRGITQAAAPAATAQPAATPDVGPDIDALVGIDGKGVEVSGDTYVLKRAWFMRELHVTAATGKGPKVAAAKPAGLTLKNVKPKSLVDLLGLKNGDVIVAINDVAVNSTDELATALKKLAGPTTVKINRKKKEMTLTYSLKD